MNRFFLALACLLSNVAFAVAGDGKPHEIQWLTFEQAEAKMKKKPKKVIVDVYTSWCGWCKKLDKIKMCTATIR